MTLKCQYRYYPGFLLRVAAEQGGAMAGLKLKLREGTDKARLAYVWHSSPRLSMQS